MTASINNSFTLPGLLAGANLSAKQYTFVKLASTANEVVSVNGTTDTIAGILQNDPTDGQVAHVMAAGVSKLVAGSTAITKADKVGWNAEGQGNTRTTATSRYGAIAVETSSADGDLIKVHLIGHLVI